ncbi:aminotransferase class III-fold pyridoxal phosphate-dependent enzyme [Lentzea sp. CA-135723]|uniref:aminotransferase class III-fold pyridoxal phosphate-dependent enzyme n=1 Tax=Lentzea sp. CA-135723 TaxID=3239950 RepID=UPI003D8C7193
MTARQEVFPGADLDELRKGRELHLDHYGRSPLPFTSLSARGIELDVADEQGEVLRLLDASGGYASACLGTGHEVVLRALRRGAEEAGHATDEIGSAERARLLNRLFGDSGLFTEHFPSGEYHVSGRNSGSEGNELALRLVLESRFDVRRLRYWPGMEQRDTIVAFEGAWHGWTSGLVPLLNRRHYQVGLPGPAPLDQHGVQVRHIPFGSPQALADYFSANADRTLAVVVEPVQGDAGIIEPPPGYLRTLSRLCAAHGVLLVADEILTFAKTGAFFAMRDDSGPVPTDITVIGKYLGMGALSTSMVIARRDLRVRASGAVSTSDLRPLTCAVVGDGLEHIVEAGLLERSAALGQHLTMRLQSTLVRRFPDVFTEARGQGVMLGVELAREAAPRLADLRTALIRAGVYVEFMAGAGKRSNGLRYVYPTMRVAPALVTEFEQADEIVDRLVDGTLAFQRTR